MGRPTAKRPLDDLPEFPARHSDHPSVSAGAPVFGSVHRVTLSQQLGTALAVPGDPNLGPGAVIDTVGGLAALATFQQAVFAPPLTMPLKQRELGPVRAIAIAADSPIASCDLWLGDAASQSRVRIAVGRPYVGDLTAFDHALVTVPISMPTPFGSTENELDRPDAPPGSNALFMARNYIWDAMEARPGVNTFNVGSSVPLRLELYRGELPPQNQRTRAPYVADFFGSMPAATVADDHRTLWMITDGRRSVELTVWNFESVNACRVFVHGHAPMPFINPTASGAISRLVDAFDVTASGLAYQGRASRTYRLPFAWYSFRIEPITVGGARGETAAALHVVARDA